VKLLELLAERPRTGQELHRLGVLGQVVEAQAQGHRIHRWMERRNPRERVWWYRLAGLNEGGADGEAEGAQPSTSSYPPSLRSALLDERPEAGGGLAAPSVSDGAGRSSSGARSTLGARTTGDGHAAESGLATSSPVSLSPPSPSTSAVAAAVNEPETRPTLFDLPNEPAWA
jgi:hypothetical protein